MSTRLNQLIAIATALSVTAIAVVALTHATPPIAAPAPLPIEPAVLLPTVIVRAPTPLTTLAGITVRPTHAERIAAGLVSGDDETPDSRGSSPLRAGSGLAMPYYSFGKPLARANKE